MRAFALALVGGFALFACGGSSQSSDASTGGSAGATTGESGGSTSTGGSSEAGTGGALTGGTVSTGGVLATGGSVTGGSPSGGAATGGIQSGGASSGGAGTGGEPNACTGWHSESFAYNECAIITGYVKGVATSAGDFPCSDSISNSTTFCTVIFNDNSSVSSMTWWIKPKDGETMVIARGTLTAYATCSSGPSCGK